MASIVFGRIKPLFFIKEVACVLCSIFGENKKALNLLEFAGILRAANWGDPLIIAKKIFSTFVCKLTGKMVLEN